MAVDRLDDLLLLGSVHADGPERLPGAAVRADERFVVLSGKRRRFMVGLAAAGADRQAGDVIFFHCASSFLGCSGGLPGACQRGTRRIGTPVRRCSYNCWWECRRAAPRA